MRGLKFMQIKILMVNIIYAFSLVVVAPGSTGRSNHMQQSTDQPKGGPTEPSVSSDTVARVTVKDGTDVQLKFAQDLSSKVAAEGDPVNLVLDQDLKVGDIVVIKAGAKAVGTITHSKKAGMMGKAGELNMRLEYLIAGDNRVKLRGSKGKEGEGKEGATVALTVLFGPIGLIKHGKNVEIKNGTPLLAYLDENYAVRTSKPN
jgi:hypothetical protein